MTATEIRKTFERSFDAVTLREALSESNWRHDARPEQLRPPGCVHWLYLAGRGAGKTRSAAERLRERIVSGEAKRITLIGSTFADVRDTMVEGESGLKAVAGDLMETYNRSIGEIVFGGGCIAKFFSGEKPDALRGWQATDVWGDELCAWQYAQQTFDMAMFGLRLGDPEAIWTTTPRPIPVLKALLNESSVSVTRSSTYANRENLSPAFFESIVKKYEGTNLGRQELDGQILDDVAGALWMREWFLREGFRVTDPEEKARIRLARCVIGLDPTFSDPDKKKNPFKEMDACGIVVVGEDEGGNPYVLRDATEILAPADWARKAVGLWSPMAARGIPCVICAEKNGGGELIGEVLKTVAANVPFELVTATDSKRTRAEPVALLYEQSRVKHVGEFPQLEDEMTSWDASNPGARSPNRIDALAWAFFGLGLCETSGNIVTTRLSVNR